MHKTSRLILAVAAGFFILLTLLSLVLGIIDRVLPGLSGGPGQSPTVDWLVIFGILVFIFAAFSGFIAARIAPESSHRKPEMVLSTLFLGLVLVSLFAGNSSLPLHFRLILLLAIVLGFFMGGDISRRGPSATSA